MISVPPNIAKCMTPQDRKAFGVELPEEVAAAIGVKVERKLQNDCENWLRLHGIEYLHLSPYAREKEGWPDLVFPNKYDSGRFWGVELKSATGQVTPEQARCMGSIVASLGVCVVCRTLEDFIAKVGRKSV